jgi:hypothetical protein
LTTKLRDQRREIGRVLRAVGIAAASGRRRVLPIDVEPVEEAGGRARRQARQIPSDEHVHAGIDEGLPVLGESGVGEIRRKRPAADGDEHSQGWSHLLQVHQLPEVPTDGVGAVSLTVDGVGPAVDAVKVRLGIGQNAPSVERTGEGVVDDRQLLGRTA